MAGLAALITFSAVAGRPEITFAAWVHGILMLAPSGACYQNYIFRLPTWPPDVRSEQHTAAILPLHPCIRRIVNNTYMSAS